MTEIIKYTTAGGIVLNDNEEVLVLERVVKRAGQEIHEVRLPKGHIDPGETATQAALREVGEESGYWHMDVIADLGVAHSSFMRNGVQYERDEHYFLMRLTQPHRGTPQPVSAEEALFEPRWLPPYAAAQALTFPAERVSAERARKYLETNTST